MPSYAWVLEVRPGYEDEYKKRHDALWPEMDRELRASGITRYTIFRHGLTLFGYFETNDIETTKAHLAKSEVNRRWSEFMGPIMRIEIDPATNFPYLLPKQWSLDP